MKKLPRRVLFSLLFVSSLLFGSFVNFTDSHFVTPAYADPSPDTTDGDGEADPTPSDQTTDDQPSATGTDKDQDAKDQDTAGKDDQKSDKDKKDDSETTDEEETPICQSESGSVSWIVCGVMDTISKGVDKIYGFIEQFLSVTPLSTDTSSPIFQVWAYMRDITNIVFIIFFLIIIYSQITGVGISNYGVKRTLPRLIITVILVNLSYIVCSLVVDTSNIIGNSIGNFLDDIITDISKTHPATVQVTWTDFGAYLTRGTIAAGIGVVAAGGVGAIFWMALIALIGALISLVIGFITIAFRQGIISVLIMISPLAFVAYLLPNTEKWFLKWRNAFFQMLFFYPMFAFVFGASKLAGWAILTSANDSMFEVLLGLTIQALPLFLAIPMMRMSGTMLGRINSSFERLTNPARGTIAKWGGSHSELARKKYLENQYLPGARLRQYLAKRQRTRELDLANTNASHENRLNSGAYNRLAGYLGRDEYGNDVYRKRPGSNTRRAKEAKLQETLAANAQKMLDNNLSDYDNTYENDRRGHKISARHAAAFEESMMQTFRAQNIAQGDQNYLLSRYMDASKHRERAPYEFNRLVRNAAGGLGMDGESTIMGQVLRQSVENEARNRRDALVVANKFNFSKPEFRRFVMDKYDINDKGIELNANGEEIEDDQYRFIKGKEDQHRQWNKYYGVHKETGREISKEQYDALSDSDRKNYKRVRYMDIYDDDGDVIQRFTENDAGYMKEMLARDIAICDPINDRYNISYGFGGPLRRYHSTISAAMGTAKYKEHSAEVGNMLLQHLNMGYIDSIGKYNIAALQSFGVASKPKDFFIGDKHFFARLKNLISCYNDDEMFAKYFPDEDIKSYPDVNGKPLKGSRFDESTGSWVDDIAYEDATLDQLKDTIKHIIIPRAVEQAASFLQKEQTPTIRENQKASGVKALVDFAEFIGQVCVDNEDSSLSIDQRLDPSKHIFDNNKSGDTASIMKAAIKQVQDMLTEAEQREAQGGSGASESLENLQNSLEHQQATNTIAAAHEAIRDLLDNAYITSPETIARNAEVIFETNSKLNGKHLTSLQQIMAPYLEPSAPTSTEDSIDQVANAQADEAERAENLRQAIEDFYNSLLDSE